MTARFWTSLAVTALVVAGCVYTLFIPPTTLPFELRLGASPSEIVILPSSDGLPLPSSLRAGDVLDWASMGRRDHLFLASPGNQPAGTRFTLTVKRDGSSLSVPVSFTPLAGGWRSRGVLLANTALTWLFAALGLLLLWRGQRRAALAVCLWCLLNVLSDVAGRLDLPLLPQVLFTSAASDLLNAGTLVALYLLADDLTRGGVSAGVRSWMRNAFVLTLIVYSTAVVVSQYESLYAGVLQVGAIAVVSTHLVAFAIPLALLALFYRRAPAADRPRIRWVWAAILLYVAAYLAIVLGRYLLDQLQANLLVVSLTALAFLGFTYAVLRHRLVSLRLVLNRAVVYGVITSLVVGTFTVLTSLVEHFAIGRTEGTLLKLLVPLSLGVTLHLVKKRLDDFVERLFFQRQFRAEAALSRFARECGFIEGRDALLDRTAEELLEHLRPTGVALYERNGAGHGRARQRGERTFPEGLPADDPALVSLRASLAEADLDELKSALGREGLAFPLAARGVLLGALVLGQRPAEHYTPAERALLARIGQQVAAALHAMRAREAEAFVDAVARGALPANPETRSRAQELLQQAVAGA